MDDPLAQLALGMIFGILFIWFGVLTIALSYPLIKGNIDPRRYNYRPWQPKFVKELTEEQAKEMGKRDGKAGAGLGVLMILVGAAAFLMGVTGNGGNILNLVWLFLMGVIVLTACSYASAYGKAKRRSN